VLRGSGFGGWDSGFGIRVAAFGFRVSGLGFRVLGFGARVSGCGFTFSSSSLLSLQVLEEGVHLGIVEDEGHFERPTPTVSRSKCCIRSVT